MRSSPKGSKHHLSGSSVAYVNLDMAGCYQLQGGEVMVPVQGYPGVMAVPAAGNPPGPGQATHAGEKPSLVRLFRLFILILIDNSNNSFITK